MISIIIPIYNEEKDITECLNSLTKQSYKNFEIILVDDGSMDKTVELVEKFKKENKKRKELKTIILTSYNEKNREKRVQKRHN